MMEATKSAARSHSGHRRRLVFHWSSILCVLVQRVGGWMKGDVVVQDFAPRMLDHEKAIQEPEGQRRYGEEVKGDDRFSMVGEEREPSLGRIAAARPQPSEIPGYCTFGDFKAELQQFPVD